MKRNQILTAIIAAVWLINGLLYKVLNLVPRHQEIVGAILGQGHARIVTMLIGIGEVCMAAWILSGRWSRLSALMQMVLIGAMNILEFVLVPHLLLWGKVNIIFAFLFILLVFYNEFFSRNKTAQNN